MTEGQARAILSAPQEKQKEIASQIENEERIPSIREISSTPEFSGRRMSESDTTALPSASTATLSESNKPEVEPAGPEPIDIGEFECSECHQNFRVEHVNRNLHRLKPVKTV